MKIVCFFIFLLFTEIVAFPKRSVRDSQDIQMVRCPEGSIFVESRVKFICKNGISVPLACIGSERINSQEIAINTTKSIDGFSYKCQMEGNTLMYLEEPRCHLNGKAYRVNETIKEFNLILKCLQNRILPVGCYFTDSAGNYFETKIGQTILIDGIQHQCLGATGSNGEKPSQQINSQGCLSDGKLYKPGDKWESKTGFIYTCTNEMPPKINVTDCIVVPGITLPVGQTKVWNNYFLKCFRDALATRLTADICGSMVNCEPGSNQGQSVVQKNAKGGTIDFTQCTEGRTFTMGHLRMQCKDGLPTPTACIASENGNNQEIPVNTTKTIDGFWYKCQIEGNSVSYTEETRCRINGKVYRINETIKDNNLIFRCQQHAVFPIGCYFTDSSGKETEAKIGETALVDGVQHVCGGMVGPGAGQFSNQTMTGAPACLHNGVAHKVGDKWESSTGFIYSCMGGNMPRVNITGCIIEAGVSNVEVGDAVVKNDYYHKCTRDQNGGVRYTKQACKMSVQCEGPNIGQPVDGQSSTNVQVIGNNDGSQVGKPQVTSISTSTTIVTTEEHGTSTGLIMTGGGTSGGSSNTGSIISGGSSSGGSVTGGSTSGGSISGGSPTGGSSTGSGTSGGSTGGNSISGGSTSAGSSTGGNTGGSSSSSSGTAGGNQCMKNNKTHPIGDEWSENGFKYICQSNARVNITACVADDGTIVALDTMLVKNMLQHQCKSRPGGVMYLALVCGSQVSCDKEGTSTSISSTTGGEQPKC